MQDSSLWRVGLRALWPAPLQPGRQPMSLARRIGWAAWAFLVVVLFGPAVGQMTHMESSLAIAYGLGALQVLPLVLVWRSPLLAWQLMAVGMFAGTLFGVQRAVDVPWPAASCAAYLFVLLMVAIQQPWPVATVVGGVTVVAIVIPAVATVGMPWSMVAVIVAVVLVTLAVGELINLVLTIQRQLRRERELRRDETNRQLIIEERTRIARELHDVVAHHMSMIAIQAQAAEYRSAELPADVRRSFAAIHDASTQGLTEMRRMVGLLREKEPDRAPPPGLSDIDDLISRARAAGLTVELRRAGALHDVRETVALSAYRIVQEALSNVVRHAPGSSVQIELVLRPGALHVGVENGPAQASLGTVEAGSGQGLVGMRERVNMHGGQLTAGPRADDGYLVEVKLPVPTRAETLESTP